MTEGSPNFLPPPPKLGGFQPVASVTDKGTSSESTQVQQQGYPDTFSTKYDAKPFAGLTHPYPNATGTLPEVTATYSKPKASKKQSYNLTNFLILILIASVGILGFDKIVNGAALEAKVDRLESTVSEQEITINGLEQEVIEKDALLSNRDAFVGEFNNYVNVLQEAERLGLNVHEFKEETTNLIELMFAEQGDASKSATYIVQLSELREKLQEVVDSEVARLDAIAEAERIAAEQAKLKANTTGTTAEQALDDITGGRVNVVVGAGICSSAQAVACVSSADPNTVRVEERFTTDRRYTYTVWYNIMMHEYAHVIQFNNFETLKNSNAFRQSFDEDFEWHADCMAKSIIGDTYLSGYNYSCSSEQLEVARAAWNGEFR